MKTILCLLTAGVTLMAANATTLDLYTPTNVTVSANPVWTDTGITFTQGDVVSISASGIWTPEGSYFNCGPGGRVDYPNWWDSFYSAANWAELIAYVGSDPYQGRWGDETFFPQSTGYWTIGTGATFTIPSNGELWLGMNDGAASKGVSDNAGSLEAQITLIPEPSSLMLLVPGGLALLWRKRR
jgi:hypothetical protein